MKELATPPPPPAAIHTRWRNISNDARLLRLDLVLKGTSNSGDGARPRALIADGGVHASTAPSAPSPFLFFRPIAFVLSRRRRLGRSETATGD